MCHSLKMIWMRASCKANGISRVSLISPDSFFLSTCVYSLCFFCFAAILEEGTHQRSSELRIPSCEPSELCLRLARAEAFSRREDLVERNSVSDAVLGGTEEQTHFANVAAKRQQCQLELLHKDKESTYAGSGSGRLERMSCLVMSIASGSKSANFSVRYDRTEPRKTVSEL